MAAAKAWSTSKLVRVCEAWQRELNLRDWAITIGYVSKDQIDADVHGASILISAEHRMADICILHPRDVPDDKTTDTETSIVHELLHIPIELFFDHKEIAYSTQIALEQHICTIASALRKHKSYGD